MSDYYHLNADAYHKETYGVDPALFLNMFIRHLPPGARILDVGCASGRDLLWLARQGYTAIGFERSPRLAEMARENSGCRVIEGDFNRFDFSPLAVDAIMMCGALVHVPHDRLALTLENILRAIAPQGASGLAYISIKEGGGSDADNRGRIFYYWQDAALRSLFSSLALDVIDFQRSLSADGEGKSWLGYVLKRYSGIEGFGD